MASVTRSSRRAEGPTPHHGGSPPMRSRTGILDHAAAGGGGGVGGGGGGSGGAGRTKRGLETADENNYEHIKPKRARIAVEILSRPSAVARNNETVPSSNKAPPSARAKPAPVVAKPDEGMRARGGDGSHKLPAASEADKNLTKHQAKVINGIKHELDRLQPEGGVNKEQGRKLRSQEATRFKSELSAYFPEYDEVIGNDPKEEHLLNVDTPIVVLDSSKQRAPVPGSQHQHYQHQHAVPQPHQIPEFPVRGYGDALYADVFDAQRIDFSFLEAQYKNKTLEDPLPDTLFEPVHRRAERLERSIRNTEKGRAQHEKDQIIRLLEGLQGHDWLRVMGVSGITETKKKAFEPARQHFIRGCQAILDKFRNWSLEEKRRKLEKERALAEQAGDDAEDEEQEVEDEDEEEEEEEEDDAAVEDEGSLGGSSEVSSPAKQLREEAMARSKLSTKTLKKAHSATNRPPPTRPAVPPAPPAPPREFKSFFAKRYERDGAVNRTRRAGRKVLAWGLPIPDFPEDDFMLPEEYRDEETLRVRARKKRRDKRSSRH